MAELLGRRAHAGRTSPRCKTLSGVRTACAGFGVLLLLGGPFAATPASAGCGDDDDDYVRAWRRRTGSNIEGLQAETCAEAVTATRHL